MIWQDILVRRSLTFLELERALAGMFGILVSHVLIVEDIGSAEISDNIFVICETRESRGEFSMHLSVYLVDGKVAIPDTLTAVKKFSFLVNSDCLISDDDVNPYSMVRVEPSGCHERAYLDVECLDRDEYVLAHGKR